MLIIIINVYSKNKNSLNNFLTLLSNFIKKSKAIIYKEKLQKQKKTKLTILKSPHVHKSAQEQFEYRIYKQQVLVFLLNPSQLLVFLKKVIKFAFYNIKIVVNYFLLNKHKNLSKFLNLNNYFLNLKSNYSNDFFLKKKRSDLFFIKKFKSYSFLKILNFVGAISKLIT